MLKHAGVAAATTWGAVAVHEGSVGDPGGAHRLAVRYHELVEMRRSTTGQVPSDKEVADATGLSRTEVWKIRRGKVARVSAETLEKLAGYFELEPSTDFFGGWPAGADNRVEILLRTYGDLSEPGRELVARFAEHTLMLEQAARPPRHLDTTPSPPHQPAVTPSDQPPPDAGEQGSPTSR